MGEEENIPTDTEKNLLDQIYQLTEQLNTLRTELARLNHIEDAYLDYWKFSQWHYKNQNKTVRHAQKQLDKQDQTIRNLTYLLGQEELKNQFVYDILSTLAYERDILAQELANEEALVDIKDRRIDNLTETITKLNFKNNRQQKQIIQLVQQLGVISKLETKNRGLTKLLKKKVKKLEKIRANKKHNRQRINSLNQKLKDLTNENIILITEKDILQTEIQRFAELLNESETQNNTLKIQLTYYEDQDPKLRETIQGLQTHTCPPCSQPHLPTPHVCPIVQQVNCSHSDYDSLKSELTQKEQKIQAQATRIRELENKPPLISIKTQTVEKIKEVEKEKIIEKPINIPSGESLIQIIEIELNSLEKELGIELSSKIREQIQKADNYQELSSLRNQIIKDYLKQNQIRITNQNGKELTVKPSFEWKIAGIIYLVVSLIIIGGLLIKLSKLKKKRVN